MADVFAAVEFVCKTHTNIDSARIGYSGGSHGGFLGAHCIVQKPDVFAAAILRNPGIYMYILYNECVPFTMETSVIMTK